MKITEKLRFKSCFITDKLTPKISTTIVDFSSFLAIIFSGIEIYFQIMLKKFNDDFCETHKLRLPRAFFFAVFNVTMKACNVAFCSVGLHFCDLNFLFFDDGDRSCETFAWSSRVFALKMFTFCHCWRYINFCKSKSHFSISNHLFEDSSSFHIDEETEQWLLEIYFNGNWFLLSL